MIYDTILFDFDGTLADSNELINRTHLRVLNERFPGVYNEESVRQFNGPSLDDVYGLLDPDHAEELIRRYREYNAELHDDMIQLFDGVAEELARLKDQGVTLAIVSTKRKDVLQKGIDVLGLHEYFAVVIGGDDYTYYKPNPEPIYCAMAELNALHGRTIMVGDNGHDIQAAKNAGIPGVFVRWSQKTVAEIEQFQPDAVIESMADLSVLIEKGLSFTHNE
ncbi:pyrophosphatase PpaX [Lacticigenium naphthae]|uniref:pyrophosphatase PpaX n=1 Tax=Lacticigenium naphthae TaxID=515351 RepID=UPI0003F97043|nr:pyrophosphatase PpaX [Lacticigenium naphthae]